MADPIGIRPTPWKTILLLCGKCARKVDGGYGPKGKDALRSALRTELSAKGLRRQVRIIETRCMGICPNGAVTALNAAKPDTILTVPRKTDPEDALALLLDGNYGCSPVLS
jgi:predicted metal-binding protein